MTLILCTGQLYGQQAPLQVFHEGLAADVDPAIFDEVVAQIVASPRMDALSMDPEDLGGLDTAYATALFEDASTLNDSMQFDLAYLKADSARQIFIRKLGYESPEVATCVHLMGDIRASGGHPDKSMTLYLQSTWLRTRVFNDDHEDLAWSFYNLGDQYLTRQDYRKAAESYRKAAMIYARVLGTTHPYVTITLTNVGNMYYYQGKPDMTIAYYTKCLDIRLAEGGEPDAGLSTLYNNIGVIYSITGKYAEAIEFLQKALDIAKLISVDEISIARSYHNIGTLYSYTGDLDQALEYTTKGLEIRTAKLGLEHPQVAESYNILGAISMDRGDYLKALDHYNKALFIREKILGTDHDDVGTVYNNIGDCFSRKGEYDRALEYFQKALSIKLPVLGPDHPSIGNIYSNIGNVHWYKGQYGEALPYYKRYKELSVKVYGTESPSLITANIQMGNCHSRLGQYDSALEHYEEALEMSNRINGMVHPKASTIYNNIGDCFSRKGDLDQAVTYIEKSIGILMNGYELEQVEQLCIRHNNLGELYIRMKNYPGALDQFDAALAYSQYSPGDHTSAISPGQLIRALTGVSRTHFEQYKVSADPIHLEKATTFIGEAIAAIGYEDRNAFEDSRGYRQAAHRGVYELALQVYRSADAVEAGDFSSRLFAVSEMSKAGVLRTGISASNALVFSGIPDSLLEQEYRLRTGIARREKQRRTLIDKGATREDSAFLAVSAAIFDSKRDLEALVTTFEGDYPDYFRLKYNAATASLEEVQQSILSDDQAMLAYFAGDSAWYALVVTTDNFTAVELSGTKALDSLVGQLNTGLSGYYGNPSQQTDEWYRRTIGDFIGASGTLYELLIEPVRHLLRKELIVVPDGILNMVPFEVLLSAAPENIARFDTYPYLLKDHAISYAYSATLLDQMTNRQHREAPRKSLIAFAPFYEGSYALLDSTVQLQFDSIDGRDTVLFNDLVMRSELAPLPSTGEEVKTASSLWNGTYYLNQDATGSRFAGEAGDYRIVHLSTHGVADARQGDYSYLAFARQDDQLENELLFVRDIYNVTLNADLVVLSACETARGEIQKGEGVISLSRAFAYAGAKSIVTTLWKVDDAATNSLLKDFYVDLRKGSSKHHSLRNAKLRYLKKAKRSQKHPFFWAGFIGVGDMRPID